MENSNYLSTQRYIFQNIWMLSNKKSFISGIDLRKYDYTVLLFSCFAHVLPKAKNKYPYFKSYARNIVLLTPLEHKLFDNGTTEERERYVQEKMKEKIVVNWNRLYELREALLAEYKKAFPSKLYTIIHMKYSTQNVNSLILPANGNFFIGLEAIGYSAYLNNWLTQPKKQ